MKNKVESLYASLYFDLENDVSDVDLDIKILCFLRLIKTEIDEFYKQTEKFNNQELLNEITFLGALKFRDSLDEAYRKLKLEDDEVIYELFNYNLIKAPDELIDIVLQLVDLNSCQSILDLCTGQGLFLSKCGKKMNHSAHLVGYEMNQRDYLISKMRFVINHLQGLISNEDVLQISLKQKYDLVFADFPWSRRMGTDVVKDEKMIVRYQKNKMKADWNYIFKAINAMNENGKAIAIVPQGALFNSLDKSYRKQVIESELLEMVIKMPAGTYQGTNIGYSILVFSKGNKKVNFVDCSTLSIGKNKNSKKIDIYQVIKKINKNKLEVSLENIKKKEYNFELERYQMDINHLVLINSQPLKTIAEVLSGYQYTSKTLTELEPGKGNIGIVKITNIEDGEIHYDKIASCDLDEKKIEKYLLKENDLLISAKGTTIKIVLVSDLNNRKLIPHNNLMVIRLTSDEVLPRFLCTFLNSPVGQKILKSIQTGNIIINITKNSLKEVRIPILDLSKQKKIVDQYNILNNEIKTIKQQLHNLQSKMDTLYEDEMKNE